MEVLGVLASMLHPGILLASFACPEPAREGRLTAWCTSRSECLVDEGDQTRSGRG